MAKSSISYFHNDAGHEVIAIGVKEFMCVGAKPPFDHPHIYIDMGSDNEKVCGYCSTLFRYDPNLGSDESRPEGCVYDLEKV